MWFLIETGKKSANVILSFYNKPSKMRAYTMDDAFLFTSYYRNWRHSYKVQKKGDNIYTFYSSSSSLVISINLADQTYTAIYYATKWLSGSTDYGKIRRSHTGQLISPRNYYVLMSKQPFETSTHHITYTKSYRKFNHDKKVYETYWQDEVYFIKEYNPDIDDLRALNFPSKDLQRVFLPNYASEIKPNNVK